MMSGKILFMTLGTGDIANQEQTLFTPLRLSVLKGEWTSVVLLPSRTTLQYADELKRSLNDLPINIVLVPLERDGLENNPDACYGHFDSVIASYLNKGFQPYDLTVDFTRGTKAMSAALVLAAVRHDIPVLRYITGERDKRGMVIPGKESVEEFSTYYATSHRILDAAYRFFVSGNFAGVLALLPESGTPFADLWPKEDFSTAQFARILADVYSKWDRLDYREAKLSLRMVADPINREDRWNRFRATDTMSTWIIALSDDEPKGYEGKAEHIRRLAADILANGERRIRDCHYEDAVIRAYRVLELIGQARLFDKGLDSGNLDPANSYVLKMVAKMEKSKSASFGRSNKGGYTAAREQVVRLLKLMNDSLANPLDDLGKNLFINKRNHHVLIHGFESQAPNDVNSLKDFFESLSELLINDDVKAEERLKIARLLDFSDSKCCK